MFETQAIANFQNNIESVDELLRFDETLVATFSNALVRLRNKLQSLDIDNPYFQPTGLLSQLENVRDNASLQPHYNQMYNQCLVLLVSHFASAARELFEEAIAYAVEHESSSAILNETLKVNVREMHELQENLPRVVGRMLADRQDMSFQDMGSISRGFRTYFDFAPERSREVNNIIVGQAYRHAIVHAGATVDRDLSNQLRNATPRDLKAQVTVGETILFTPSEIEVVAKSMTWYLRELAEGIRNVTEGE